VNRNPADRFAGYAFAMELRKIGAWSESHAAFEALHVHHPDFGAGYYHHGACLREAGDAPAARAVLVRGLDACARSADGRTRSEIEGLLAELEDAAD
jgi:hypothetical protein